MKIIYGTTNNAKYIALKKIFKNLKIDVDIETLKDIGFEGEIIEDGKTFEENSEIKALAIKKFCDDKNIKGRIIITDDSGLCVDILNGEPGVYSARYASENATQEEILQKLLKNMEKEQDLDKRTANFVSVLTAILENGEKIVARGECLGRIATKYNMLGGLTYAPVFIPEGFSKPMVEMDEKEYAESHNHREKAVRILIEEFKKRNI
ncbi:MAG: non-canonical purine NTP pyrophosphatase [Clostridia bacterium]|nr:non-canonical purine NTP pyrophosphatase [Clostridia bacterium]